MKPQALQDAIKAAAAKKKERIANQGWKEPEVKKLQISKDEYQQIKSKAQPVPVISNPVSTTGSSSNSTDISQLIVKERQEWKRDMMVLLKEVKESREEIGQLRKELRSTTAASNNANSTNGKLASSAKLEEIVENLTSKVEDMGHEIEMLRRENEKLRGEVSARFEEIRENQQDIRSSGITKKKFEPSLEPHGVEKLYEHQRRDELLREFITNQSGPYDVKESKVKTIDDKNLVFFRKRIYIPKRLRRDTVKYYCTQFPGDSKDELARNCIWPELDEDFELYKGL